MDCENEKCIDIANCKIEAIVSVDERGQIVLPKDVRESAGIQAGDKLALIGFRNGNHICCITLVKSEELNKSIKDFLEPVIKHAL